MPNLIKSKERVSDFGEVFTPPNIVNDMIKLIPDSCWENSSYIVFEPTCGNGNFVVQIVEKKIECGLTIEQAINTTFALDIQQDNIDECRKRVYEICLKNESNKNKLKRCCCIIVNNIKVTKDSLEFMKNGQFNDWKFFDEDPTNYKGVKKTGLGKFSKPEEIKLQILDQHDKNQMIQQGKQFYERMVNEKI